MRSISPLPPAGGAARIAAKPRSRSGVGSTIAKPQQKPQTPRKPTYKPRNTARARRLRREATPAERALWPHLARAALGAKFSRQMPVGPYFADFLCRELKLAIELDGHSHDLRPDHDARRDAWLRENGYIVLHFPNAEVHENLEGVVTAIREKIKELRN